MTETEVTFIRNNRGSFADHFANSVWSAYANVTSLSMDDLEVEWYFNNFTGGVHSICEDDDDFCDLLSPYEMVVYYIDENTSNTTDDSYWVTVGLNVKCSYWVCEHLLDLQHGGFYGSDDSRAAMFQYVSAEVQEYLALNLNNDSMAVVGYNALSEVLNVIVKDDTTTSAPNQSGVFQYTLYPLLLIFCGMFVLF